VKNSFKPLQPVVTPSELVDAVRRAEPSTPPARLEQALRGDDPTATPNAVGAAPRTDLPATLNLRLRTSSIEAIAAMAELRGVTLKQVVTLALREAGVTIAAEDLVDRSTKRRGSR
jgi:hypothetical protein